MFDPFLHSERSEVPIRFIAFLAVLLSMAVWELLAPRRSLSVSKSTRWLSNLGFVLLNSLVLRLLVPTGLTGVAVFSQSRGWGLLNVVWLSGWLSVGLSIILLDLAVYIQHVMFHALPLCWRLHMVHHADLDFDVSTGLRFHSLEILLSFAIKSAVVILLGASATAVLLFEITLNATSMFTHSNIRLPLWLDRWLRLMIVTPDMHRVHHSVVRNETNSNFGFSLSWWDYLLGTYRDQPVHGHEQMTIGLTQFRDERVERLPWMLTLPFWGAVGEYPVNRGDKEENHHGEHRGHRVRAH
jgi:sterol desaturase/sphingolipid hydroxylase (fatty acid hydroxylase superfamily)